MLVVVGEILEDCSAGGVAGQPHLGAISVFRVAKKLSLAALSKQDPVLPIEARSLRVSAARSTGSRSRDASPSYRR